MLKLDNVSCTFEDGTRAVDAVSLQVEEGEFCVLLGPSGAGKSTLMNIMNGVIEPTTGSLQVGDVDLNRHTRRLIQTQIGMIHQQLHIVPRLSVLHNVLLGILPQVNIVCSLLKLFTQEQQRKACQLLQEVGLEEKHLYRRAAELSGGQQQRVAIARAFISQPKVVLADEPVASLDPSMSRSVLNNLKTAAKTHGATVICTLHQIDYALEFGDRVIALRDGKIFFDGSPKAMDKATQNALYALVKVPPSKSTKLAQVAA